MTTLQHSSAGAGTTGPRRWALPAAVLGAVGSAATVLHTVDPYEAGHYPTCPLLMLTGWWCPGCGALRGTHDLLHGDVAGTAARNPLLLLAVPYLVLALGAWLLRRTGRRVPSTTSAPPWVIWGVLAVVVVFGVLRNVPGFTWLSPA
ncbi:DUF2752 domain-containing protein [Nocardioides marmoraquaticus]